MKILRATLAGMLLAGGLAALDPGRALSQQTSLVQVDITVVANGYRVSQLIGKNVTNEQNERVGTLDDVIVSRDRVLFAVVQVGGFLGLGSRLVALPYESLVIQDGGQKVMLPGATREQLKNLAEFKYAAG